MMEGAARAMPFAVVILVLFASSCIQTEAFYLPGVAPREYALGENVTIKVNSIKSVRTAIPYDYYSVMHCRPVGAPTTGKIKHDPENLGEILWGESIKASRYSARMRIDVTCAKLCTTYAIPDTEAVDKKGHKKSEAEVMKAWNKRNPIKKLKQRIDDEYRGHLILDNLPVSEVFIWEKSKEALFYRRGYPLGRPGNSTTPTLVNNHLAFTIKWHSPVGLQGYRIVGFNVYPYSVASDYIDKKCKDDEEWEPWTYPPQEVNYKDPKKKLQKISFTETSRVSWSYSVTWKEDPDVAWTSRWDHYLHSADSADSKIHWFSIVNSLLVVLFLSVMVFGIMRRALHRDFNRYNNPDNEFEQQEETGWKLVHGDVFRDPPYPRLLACYLGVSAQLLGMAVATVVCACFGFLSPANRGALMTAMLVLFVLMGWVGGNVSARVARMFHEVGWSTPLMTALFVPGKVFLVFLVVNIVMGIMQASNAVSFFTMTGIVLLWFGCSTPLVLFGALVGFKKPTWEHPLVANQVPRVIPPQPWFLNPWVVIPCAGLIPFMACFIEVSFILSSLWQNKFYYVFGFLGIVFCILLVTCAQTAVVGTYFQLCFEDYNWWWRSFLLTGSCGPILFLYSIYYFFTTLQLTKIWSAFMYFGYMAVISYCFGILTGGVGFAAAFVFVQSIYSQLKVD